MLTELAARLSEPARAAFLAVPERARALAGNHVAFSLRRAEGPARATPLPALAEDLFKRL